MKFSWKNIFCLLCTLKKILCVMWICLGFEKGNLKNRVKIMNYKCSFHFVLVTVTPFKFGVHKTIYSING